MVRRKKTRGEINNVFVDMSSMLDPYEECSAPRIVLIEGEPGMRKKKGTPTTGPPKSKHLKVAAPQHSKHGILMFGKPLMSNFCPE